MQFVTLAALTLLGAWILTGKRPSVQVAALLIALVAAKWFLVFDDRE